MSAQWRKGAQAAWLQVGARIVGGEALITDMRMPHELFFIQQRMDEANELVHEPINCLPEVDYYIRALLHAVFTISSTGACIIKRCGRCRTKYYPSSWFHLPLVGYQISPMMGGEMRNCGCGSTLLLITWRNTI